MTICFTFIPANAFVSAYSFDPEEVPIALAGRMTAADRTERR